ncbi:MAG: hypothetical protein EOO53_07045 [Gammaproteobacteria bacterium]|nr:MAG: hypothetical protein EOO53_07045 [Gammaproteobacteria bacterium]
MKNIIGVMALLVALGSVAIAEAKTTRYELSNARSSQGWINYPGLDFNNVTSAVLIVTKTPPAIEPKIVSLEVTFPNMAKLTATNFKLIEGRRYRALVAGAWIYKEVIVDLDSFQLDAPIHFGVFVSERTAFINPVSDNQSLNASLFTLNGLLTDVTATKVVDQEILTVANKKLTLSLRDRLIYQAQPRAEGFAIDALWYGKGAKTLIIPAPVPRDFFDNIDVVGIAISGTASDPLISVKFKDYNGGESQSPQVRLRDLLDQNYGPTPWL